MKVKSEVFCKTLEIWTKDFNERTKDNRGIKLFKIELSEFEDLVPNLMTYLTPFEQNRANGYHFLKDKNRFVICRTILKFLLAEQTGLEINKIILDKDSNKKPYLPSHPSVFFNVTHADAYAIIALSISSVGVDIEKVNKDFDYTEMLPSIFNKSEIDEVFNSNDKHRAFYRLWTRKEAIVKATGKGIDDYFLSIPSLDGYHKTSSELIGNIKKLQVFSFELDEDYIGAVACSEIPKGINNLIFYPLPLKFREL